MTNPDRYEDVARCPVCASDRRQRLFEGVDWLYRLPGRFPLERCADCGLGYLSRRPTSTVLPGYYPDETYYAYRKPAPYALFGRKDLLAAAWYLTKRSVLAYEYGYTHLGGSRLLAQLLRLPPLARLHVKATFQLGVLLHPWVPGGALLEVGCGAGMYLDLMRSLGWTRVTGVDMAAKAVAQARSVLGLDAYTDLREAPEAAGGFDAVSLSHTLEHVAEPVALLAAVRERMAPGGRLAVVVPNMQGLGAQVFGEFWVGWDVPRHLLDFTPGSLRLALERAGFEVESLTTRPDGAYQVALFSHSRQAGDPHSVYTDAEKRFPATRRVRALAVALRARLACALGRPVGEEISAVARTPA